MPNLIILTAKEAYKKASNISDSNYQHLIAVSNLILEEAEKGNFSCVYYDEIPEELKVKLQSPPYDYKIEKSLVKSPFSNAKILKTVISWEDA